MMHHDESESTKDTSGKVSGYGTKQYWDKRYSKPDSSDSQHEWYFTYQELEPILEPCLTTLFESRWVDDVKYGVVEIGCGTQPLLPSIPSSDSPLLGLDYSPVCIKALSKSNKKKLTTYKTQDCRDLTNILPSCSAHMVIEKGTLDAMIVDSIPNCVSILSEMCRVSSKYVVVVTHFNINTEEGEDWVSDVFYPALESVEEEFMWLVKCHTGGEDGPVVYVCEKKTRRITRGNGGKRIQIEILEH